MSQNRENLRITGGGFLTETRHRYVEETKARLYEEFDVTHQAVQYLFDACELDNVTLKDIFLLIQRNLLTLKPVLRGWCEEFLDEGLNRPAQPVSRQDIEYLQLSKFIEIANTPEEKLGQYIDQPPFASFGGIGYPAKEEYEEHGIKYPKGYRVNWGVSFLPVNELINLPIKLNNTLQVIIITSKTNKNDPLNYNYDIKEYEGCSFTLGEILYGIMWELSFYGPPERRDVVREELFDQVKSIKEVLNEDNKT